jgi:hypothetical protein
VNTAQADTATAPRVIPATIYAGLSVAFVWGAQVLPWHAGPSLGWALWALGGLHGTTSAALAFAPEPRQVLRCCAWGSAALAALVVSGVSWGVISLVRSFAALGQGFGAVVLYAIVDFLILVIPSALWAHRASQRTFEAPLQRGLRQRSPRLLVLAPLRIRLLPALLSAAAPALTLWPLTWARGEDSFPLSSYPMFTSDRRNCSLVVLVGTTTAGATEVLPVTLIAPGETLQAKAVLDRWSHDLPALERWCEQQRVTKPPALEGISRVDVERRVYDLEQYFKVLPQPQTRQTVFQCDLEPGAVTLHEP